MVFLCLIWFVVDICSAQLEITYCYNQSECTGQNMTTTGELRCYGFDSCSNATAISTGYLQDFYASGAYSAYNAKNVNPGGSLRCWGESSCRRADINYVNTVGNNTECHGTKSCFEATITRSNSSASDGDIHFSGYKSGAYSTLNLNQTSVIYAYGALSLLQATINMYRTTEIYSYQDFSLSGASLYCARGQICTIYCYHYSCADISSATGEGGYSIDCRFNSVINLLCNETGDLNDELSIDIYSDLPSALIETLTNGAPVDVESVDDDVIYTLYKNLSKSTAHVLGINCGNYEECKSETFNYSNQAIVCSGAYGCEDNDGSLLVNTTLLFNDNEWNKTDLDIDLLGIYCGGDHACGTTTVQTSGIYNSSVNSFNIYCNGKHGCWSTVKGADNLFCGGFESCYIGFIGTDSNIYGAGQESLDNAKININSLYNPTGRGDIYCVAYEACFGAQISDAGRNVYGFGYESIYTSRINEDNENIIEKIYAIGYQAGFYTEINSVNTLYASGYRVLMYSIISGIRNLYVSGREGLRGSLITTGLSINDSSINSTVILDISGTNDFTIYDTFTVICSFGDECYIYCRSNTSCTSMILICHGICYLDCGNYTISSTNSGTSTDCPQSINGTYGAFPTPIPTNIPTTNPTNIPTIVPTEPPPSFAPSEIPTGLPTTLPTALPTTIPTTDPTEMPTLAKDPLVVSSTMGISVSGNRDNGSDDTLVIVVITVGCCYFESEMNGITKEDLIQLQFPGQNTNKLHIVKSESQANLDNPNGFNINNNIDLDSDENEIEEMYNNKDGSNTTGDHDGGDLSKVPTNNAEIEEMYNHENDTHNDQVEGLGENDRIKLEIAPEGDHDTAQNNDDTDDDDDDDIEDMYNNDKQDNGEFDNSVHGVDEGNVDGRGSYANKYKRGATSTGTNGGTKKRKRTRNTTDQDQNKKETSMM